MLQPPPGLRTIKGDKYKEAVASLWEHAEPDAQRLLREAGIPPPEEAGEESPAKQLSRCMQEYKRVTAWHRSLLAKMVKLQAKTESIKKQFEEAVDQLAEVSGKIDEAEAQIERAHALVKEKVNEPKPPKLLAITGPLKEAGVDLQELWTSG